MKKLELIVVLVILSIFLLMIAISLREVYHRRIKKSKGIFLDHFFERLKSSENYIDLYDEDLNDPELEKEIRDHLALERKLLEKYRSDNKISGI